MLECLVIGDSIAVGISHFRKECVTHARSGWTSAQWNKHYLTTFNSQLPVKSLIISLGTNDYKGLNTVAELNKIRENVSSTTRVFWVLPPKAKPLQREMVREVAEIWGDMTLTVPDNEMAGDKIHPTYAGYRKLAEAPGKRLGVIADISPMKE
jgi:lysophospholipase L1-like esterase